MKEATGNLWLLAEREPAAWVVVPTNGCVSASSGRLVMGAGVARDAEQRHPGLAAALGEHVRSHGNVPAAVEFAHVLSWPTKPVEHVLDGRPHAGWMCGARVKHPDCERQVARLVWSNAPLIVAAADQAGITGPIFMPHVGCGLGGLSWAKVGPALAGILDDRFVAVAHG